MQLVWLNVADLIAQAGGDPWEINRSLQAGSPFQISQLAGAFHQAGRCTQEADHAFQQARDRFDAAWNHQNGDHPINGSAEVQRTVKSLGAQSLQLPKIAVDLENIAAALAEAQKAGANDIAALEAQLQQLDNIIGAAAHDLQDPNLDANSRSALQSLINDAKADAADDTRSALGQLQGIRNGYSGTLQNSLTTLRADGYDPKPLAPADAQAGPEEFAIPPPSTKPEDVKRWWDSLSQQERDQLLAQHPPELGNLNGIDTISRDTVNQAVMNDDISRVENAAAQHHVSVDQVTQHPELYGLAPSAITRYNNAVKTKAGLSTDSDGGKNPVFLQTYDPEAFEGRGREAIAIGNPDTADNTTVLVPGTGSSVRDGYLTHRDGLNVYNEAQRADPNKSNSVLVWMGYHAPDSAIDPQIGQTTLARNGGGLLAGDVNALAVTHGGAPSHVTVMGHSYGSTTVADAAAGSGMHANDIVLVGCPGTDLAHSAGDFHLPEGGHVYVGAASTDPITHLGGIQGHLPGTGVTIGLGSDPAVEGFGSTRFKAEAPGLTFPLKDHSSYFTPGNESLFSIGDIASGHGDALAHDSMTAQHRGTYWLPDEFDPESLRRPTGGHYH
ncbi:alpha/beta hydrolase [Mycobacterium intracellulare]|uniref:putative alpha/beta hydrolase n=1 Tax=Mycobacterium intracellulare TaxID=1767 RepID=UPI001EEDD7F5|nr:alpha/beta hydrolase [Mycobacterium intracellulare]MEE3750096.1 alpha/beta hydrolase [Mycobacterium intracellulare]